jgi:hypothetical protein
MKIALFDYVITHSNGIGKANLNKWNRQGQPEYSYGTLP